MIFPRHEGSDRPPGVMSDPPDTFACMVPTDEGITVDEIEDAYVEFARSLAGSVRQALRGQADFPNRTDLYWDCYWLARAVGGQSDRETKTVLSLVNDPKGIRSYWAVADALDAFAASTIKRIEAGRAERARNAARNPVEDLDIPF